MLPYCSLLQLTIPMRLAKKSGTYTLPAVCRITSSAVSLRSWLLAAPHTSLALIRGMVCGFRVPPVAHGHTQSTSSNKILLSPISTTLSSKLSGLPLCSRKLSRADWLISATIILAAFIFSNLSTKYVDTFPPPWTAKVLPATLPAFIQSNAASIAHATPYPVITDGLPLPPTSTGIQVVKRVWLNTASISRVVTPRSSAVI
mmetsp:Transcript_4935/g.9546  ORF Transcript_4935/g.9546 Transcript_4935/m.9546 type:complete len:202 (+) Transcript_4935:469-1074(+)